MTRLPDAACHARSPEGCKLGHGGIVRITKVTTGCKCDVAIVHRTLVRKYHLLYVQTERPGHRLLHIMPHQQDSVTSRDRPVNRRVSGD